MASFSSVTYCREIVCNTPTCPPSLSLISFSLSSTIVEAAIDATVQVINFLIRRIEPVVYFAAEIVNSRVGLFEIRVLLLAHIVDPLIDLLELLGGFAVANVKSTAEFRQLLGNSIPPFAAEIGSQAIELATEVIPIFLPFASTFWLVG